jgi:tetratricopeptide (TPR) repeat protein
VSVDSATERFWRELRTLYGAAGKPTLRRLVHLGLQQQPQIAISDSTVNGWLNRKAIPTGRKNERYLAAMISFLQAGANPDTGYQRLPPGEWGRLLRAAQAERAAGKQLGRPRSAEMRSRATKAPAAIPCAESRAENPLFGRDAELAILGGRVKEVADRRGGVVLIDGEPGIGKSSLARAAATEAARLGCRVLWGTCGELDQAIPLEPVLQALGAREPSGSPRRTMIARFLRGEAGVDRGTDGPAVVSEQLLALVAEECAAQPTVLVIDDLQWADTDSVRLLSRLTRVAAEVPLLLVGLMRPVPQRDDLVALRRAAGGLSSSRVHLAGLSEAAAAELVRSLAGGSPSAELLRLLGDADGNPLFLTEMVAALTRSSSLSVGPDGIVTVTSGLPPRSLGAVIEDRLASLSGPTREVLRTASLLGVDFTVTDLVSVRGCAVCDIAPALDEARAGGVLAEAGDRLRFRHPLIHAAFYEAMPKAVRRAWHGETARALARSGAAADRIARQLLWSADDPDGSPEPMDEWVLNWLDHAAERLVVHAPQAAARLLAHALASEAGEAARRGRFASRLADALYRTGERKAAEQVAANALEHAPVDSDLLVDLHWTLALCQLAAGRVTDSLAVLDRIRASPDLSPRHRARVLVQAARTRSISGRIDDAARDAGEALAVATQAGDHQAMGWALLVMALNAMGRGELAEALTLCDRVLEVPDADPAMFDLRLLAQINKAAALGNLNRQEEAIAVATRACQLASQVGTSIRLAQAHAVRTEAYFEAGRWDDALAEMVIVPESMKERPAVCGEMGMAAVISFHRGDADAARRYLRAAVPHAERIGDRLVPTLALARALDHEQAGALLDALGTLTRWLNGGTEEVGQVEYLVADATRLAMRAGQPEVARALALRAAQFAAGLDTPYRRGSERYCRGLVDGDASLLIDAAAHYRQAGRPLERAKALEAAAAELTRSGDHVHAQAVLADAMDVYSELGAARPLSITRLRPGSAAGRRGSETTLSPDHDDTGTPAAVAAAQRGGEVAECVLPRLGAAPFPGVLHPGAPTRLIPVLRPAVVVTEEQLDDVTHPDRLLACPSLTI